MGLLHKTMVLGMFAILYSGKLLRKKLSQILRFCGKARKFSLQNLGCGILWHGTSEQSAKIIFFTNPRKFSPSKVSRYMVLLLLKRKPLGHKAGDVRTNRRNQSESHQSATTTLACRSRIQEDSLISPPSPPPSFPYSHNVSLPPLIPMPSPSHSTFPPPPPPLLPSTSSFVPRLHIAIFGYLTFSSLSLSLLPPPLLHFQNPPISFLPPSSSPTSPPPQTPISFSLFPPPYPPLLFPSTPHSHPTHLSHEEHNQHNDQNQEVSSRPEEVVVCCHGECSMRLLFRNWTISGMLKERQGQK